MVSGGAVAGTAPAAHAERGNLVGDLVLAIESFLAADFVDAAAGLPAALREAIRRDLGIDPAQYLADAEAARSAAAAAEALRERGVDVLGTSIDGQDVTIRVASEDDVEAAAATGAAVEVGAAAAMKSERTILPARDHLGGYGYAYQAGEFDDDTGTFPLGRCSAGFSGYDADGNDQFLTAGHCGVDEETGEPLTSAIHHIEQDEPIWGGEAWGKEYPGSELGEFVPGSATYGGQHDAALVDVTSEEWTAVPRVAGWGGGAGEPDEESFTVLGAVSPVAGSHACKSGATSGWTCGEILVPEQVTTVGDEDVTGFVFNACLLGGDSGGAIVVGRYALGVNSGSSHDGRTDCDTWRGATGPDDTTGDFSVGYAVGGGKHNALELYGDRWELAVAVSTPHVSAPRAGGRTGPTPTFTGVAAGARDTHRARVVIDGVHDYAAQLDADGAFAVEVTEPLEPGEHTFAVRVTYRRHSESRVVEGTFTVTESAPEASPVASPIDKDTGDDAPPAGTEPPDEPDGDATEAPEDDSEGDAGAGEDDGSGDGAEGRGDDGEGESLPDTGSSSTWLIVAGVVLLLAGGAIIVLRAKARRSAG